MLFEYPSLNGGEYSFFSMVPALAASNIQVTALGPLEGDLALRLAAENLQHVPFRLRLDDGNRKELSRLRQNLADVLAEVQPGLVHANSLSMSRIIGPVAKELGIPSLAHLRDILRLSKKAIADINCCDRILCVSAAVEEYHVAAGMDSSRMHVQYNGVNLDAFGSVASEGGDDSVRRELGIPEESQLIVSIGQLGLRKATHRFVECAARLADEFPSCHWLVIGERHSTKHEAVEYEASIRRLAEDPRLSGRIHFLGRRQDVPRVLQQCDLLVHTAVQEPLGRVLLEAAATGLAVVATDVGGTREIFPENSMASIVAIDPADSTLDRLVSAVRPILSEPAIRSAMGFAARQQAEKCFNAAERGIELVRHYYGAAGVVPPQHL